MAHNRLRPALPELRTRRRRWRSAVVAAAIATVGIATAPSAAHAGGTTPPAASVAGMRILITNDDGVQPGTDSVGLYELRKALCSAGADVVVVGPWRNMSGASASITFGSSATRLHPDPSGSRRRVRGRLREQPVGRRPVGRVPDRGRRAADMR